jgi:PEGA domain-containing protein
MAGVPEAPVSAVSCDAQNTLAQCLEILWVDPVPKSADFGILRNARKITLSSEPIDGCTASLLGSDIFQRHIFILILDVDESRVSLVESAATRVLAGQANWDSGFYQTREGESFRPCRSPRGAGMGTVSIKTQPKGAQIAVNKHMLDKSSPVDGMLDPGNYIVDITLTGYAQVHKVITVDKGGKAVVDEVLQPESRNDICSNPALEKIETPETRPDLSLIRSAF